MCTEDKYACIADLDDDQEDEKWRDRTELITRKQNFFCITVLIILNALIYPPRAFIKLS